MKRNLNTLVIAALLVGSVWLPAHGQLFTSESVLSDGRWVKIAIPESGVYELPYEQLREMGFTNPAEVAVFGRGGARMSVDLTDESGNVLYSDDLKPVGVMKGSDCLYFYALGPEDFTFNNAYDGYVDSAILNIYSRNGYYFLTDSRSQTAMPTETVSGDAAALRCEDGVGVLVHSIDLSQGIHRAGQVYWGEDLTPSGTPQLEWDVFMPDLRDDSATMHVGLYTGLDVAGTLNFGLREATGNLSSQLEKPSGIYYKLTPTHYPSNNHPYTLTQLSGVKSRDKAFVEVTGGLKGTVCALDFWSITYPKSIPTLPEGLPQDMILFPQAHPGVTYTIPAAQADVRVMLQVTDPRNVTRLSTSPGDGAITDFTFTAAGSNPRVVMFDTTRPQKHISGYETVTNQNLHALAAEGADLAIITVPHLRHLAEGLAEVHRRLEGLSVAVVTVDELYNEFSGGVPDIMAYRTFAIMMYNSPGRRLRNICLYGPSVSDIRGMQGEIDPHRYIIAPQDDIFYYDAVPNSNYDFPGYIVPCLSAKRIELTDMNVGVGVLSVQNEHDAEIVRKKVEDFILSDDFAYRLNRMVSLGGEGDRQTHSKQALQLGSQISTYNFQGEIVSNICVDAYGYKDARSKIMETLASGPMVWSYFGHGSCGTLGMNHDFFTLSRLGDLNNTMLPFMSFAGCDLSMPDLNKRGLGEAILLNTPHGAIGTLMCTRTSWSGQNMELMRAFYSAWTRAKVGSSDLATIEHPLTLGEIYARTKTSSQLPNELSYTLMADPSLVMPAVLRRVMPETVETQGKAKVVPGHDLNLSGSIGFADKTSDAAFNGEVVIRLLEPAIEINSHNVVTNDTTQLTVNYNDSQAAMTVAKVENGRFEAAMPIPSSLNRYAGKKMRVVMAAYDKERRMGAAGEYVITCSTWKTEKLPEPTPDAVPPTILSFVYLPELNEIRVEAADDKALGAAEGLFSDKAFTLSIDGTLLPDASVTLTRMNNVDPRSASRSYPLTGISYGNHRAVVEVRDAEGNATQGELLFTIDPDWAALTLEMTSDVACGKASFLVKGMVDSEVTLYILDYTGREVYRGSSKSAELEWDCSDMPKGIYKAFVRETGGSGTKAHSKAMNVTVI